MWLGKKKRKAGDVKKRHKERSVEAVGQMYATVYSGAQERVCKRCREQGGGGTGEKDRHGK